MKRIGKDDEKLKHKDEYKQYEFIDWLSIKLGQKIGNVLGSGLRGTVFEFGRNANKAIKLSINFENDTHSVLNKNIKGVVKIYAHGNILVPERFINKGGFGGSVGYIEVPRDSISIRSDGKISYIIMEKLTIDDELTKIIGDLTFLILRFHRENNLVVDTVPLRILFKKCEDIDFLQKFYNYISEKSKDGFYKIQEFGKITETLAELCVLFKKIKKDFDWVYDYF